MRKTQPYIFCLMLISCAVCQAQKLSIKPYFHYHQSVSKQEEPVFHNNSSELIAMGSFSKEFTLATGWESGLAIDYTFHNQLGFELGLGYFSCQSAPFTSLYRGYYETEWDYHSIAVRPLFGYTVTKGKSGFIGKIGPTIHYASASMSCFGPSGAVPSHFPLDFVYEKYSTCTFADKLNLGYLIAFEYNYHLSKRLSLVSELGCEQYNYTPRKATVEYDDKFIYKGEKKEILYVNKIDDKLTWSDYNPPSKNKRLKESIFFNNIYFGIGLKYNLREK